MATRRQSIINWSASPDDEDVFIEKFSVKATNDLWKRFVIIFNDTSTRIGLHGGFTVPQQYQNSANLVISWTSTATTGDVEWDFDYRVVNGDDLYSLDQASAQESVNQNDTAPTAALRRLEVSISLTDGNFLPGAEVEYTLFRDCADAGDTMAAAAIVFSTDFEYSDT